MSPFTPVRILMVLLFYAALFVVMSLHGRKIGSAERKTFLLLWLGGFVIALGANYLLFRLGVMSFLPWINNFLHTFFWIGLGFPYLYFGSTDRSAVVRFVLFTTFSLIVKYAEQLLFGTWEADNFFRVFHGNFAYIMGWSTVDGSMPFVMALGLRLVGRWIPGLVLA